jgi:DNA-directed RNA polymerase subunit N (RpoN/RPB10)
MIGHLQISYDKQLNDIINNPKLTDQEKDISKQKLVNSFGLRRYCCIMRLMTYKRLIEIVK